jgi:P pilus assembly chaperone PapD
MHKKKHGFAYRPSLLILTATLALPACQARAQVLISPVVIELGARQRAAAVTVSLGTTAHASMLLQSEVVL